MRFNADRARAANNSLTILKRASANRRSPALAPASAEMACHICARSAAPLPPAAAPPPAAQRPERRLSKLANATAQSRNAAVPGSGTSASEEHDDDDDDDNDEGEEKGVAGAADGTVVGAAAHGLAVALLSDAALCQSRCRSPCQ